MKLKNNTQRILLAVVSISALTLSHSVFSETPLQSSELANSVEDFSDSQGKHGWSYGYWNQSLDKDGAYDPNTDFEMFKNFGVDLKNGLSRHNEFETGNLWYLEDGQYYTSLWAKGGHPHANMELGTYKRANHWTVRRWISGYEGDAVIKGVFGKEMPWGELWGGKVIYQIAVDGNVLFQRPSDQGEEEYSLKVQLKPDTKVDFMIGPGTAIGVVNFTGSIYKSD